MSPIPGSRDYIERVRAIAVAHGCQENDPEAPIQQVFHVSLYELHIGLNGDLHSVVRKQKTEPLVTFVCLKTSTEFDMPVQKFDFALRRTRGTSFISLASSEKKPPLLEVVESRRSVMDRQFAQHKGHKCQSSPRDTTPFRDSI